ncbi:hypothetical protein CDAR_568221 [Caerostris darwini]|uniref:Uncharacterized protein n=1 Tax=Caerostris darwini TaxID=1538125 RepID=A0AAV4UU05_9ARAC|nr:hypothetical protein CDAR_568221 [Caerostris darwini]
MPAPGRVIGILEFNPPLISSVHCKDVVTYVLQFQHANTRQILENSLVHSSTYFLKFNAKTIPYVLQIEHAYNSKVMRISEFIAAFIFSNFLDSVMECAEAS